MAAEMKVDEAEKTAFNKLQNGSDIRGVAVDGVEGEPITLSATRAFYIVQAFAQTVAAKTGKPLSEIKISIGRDPRISGADLTKHATAALLKQGVKLVKDVGLSTTPAMFYMTVTEGHMFDGAMMITASHMPYNRNGIKFFTNTGGYDKKDVKAMLGIALDLHSEQNGDQGVSEGLQLLETEQGRLAEGSFLPDYCSMLKSMIKREARGAEDPELPLKGFKVVVDAGNGSGGFIATQVLEPLGADVSGSQFIDPDGMFPNHMPNPEDKAAMAAGVAMVEASGADLGIIFDTDVDRSAVVDQFGKAINANRMIALMSAITLEGHPGTTVVTDSVTSNGLKSFIEGLGGKHFRYRRGYKNVISKGVELNQQGIDCQLMIETSGHGAMKENYYLDDGAYMAIKIVAEMVSRKALGKPSITQLLGPLKEPKEAREFRLNITEAETKPVADKVLDDFVKWVQGGAGGASNWELSDDNEQSQEGWRVNVDEGSAGSGWVLLRASIHDPLMVLNIESEAEGGLKTSALQLNQFFQEHPDYALDLSNFTSVL